MYVFLLGNNLRVLVYIVNLFPISFIARLVCVFPLTSCCMLLPTLLVYEALELCFDWFKLILTRYMYVYMYQFHCQAEHKCLYHML